MKQSGTRYRSPRLRDIIRHQGRTYRWVAMQAGLNPSQLSRLFAGEITIDEERARRLAAVLQLPFDLVFELPDERDTLPKIRDADRVA